MHSTAQLSWHVCQVCMLSSQVQGTRQQASNYFRCTPQEVLCHPSCRKCTTPDTFRQSLKNRSLQEFHVHPHSASCWKEFSMTLTDQEILGSALHELLALRRRKCAARSYNLLAATIGSGCAMASMSKGTQTQMLHCNVGRLDQTSSPRVERCKS